MEIILQPSCSHLTTQFLHQPPPPFLRRFHKPLPTSLVSNIRPLFSSSKTLPTTSTTTYSLPDDDFSGFATKDATKDPAFPVMKKAVDVVHELKGASIFLVGIHSTMKTGVGELLAEVLGYYYFDSDDVVEEAASGESAGKSFRERDEEGFRESETEVLKQLSAMGRLVVCVGNGAVQSITNLALLKYGVTVWIDVPLDMVARDVIEHESQFSSSDITSSGSYSEVLNQLAELYEKNKDGYAEADVAVSLLSITDYFFSFSGCWIIFFPQFVTASLSFAEVATQLGYDDLAAVTKEDVSLQILKELEKSTRVRKMKEEAARPF